MTIIELVSVTGVHTRYLVIFKNKNVQTSWFRHDTTPDWLYTCLSNGWTTNSNDLRWLNEIFLSETASNIADASQILLLNNYDSHIIVDFM